MCRVPDDKSLSQKVKKKKKAKKGSKPENDSNVKEPVTVPEEHEHKARTFSNGLSVEELSMGKPDGKKASPGRKVVLSSMIYLVMHVYIYVSWFHALRSSYICLILYVYLEWREWKGNKIIEVKRKVTKFILLSY